MQLIYTKPGKDLQLFEFMQQITCKRSSVGVISTFINLLTEIIQNYNVNA